MPESLIFVVVCEVHLNKRMSVLPCGKMLLSIAEIHQDNEMTLDVPRIWNLQAIPSVAENPHVAIENEL